MTILLVAVFGIFGTFAAAVIYAQVQTRGIVAPGGRRVDCAPPSRHCDRSAPVAAFCRNGLLAKVNGLAINRLPLQF